MIEDIIICEVYGTTALTLQPFLESGLSSQSEASARVFLRYPFLRFLRDSNLMYRACSPKGFFVHLELNCTQNLNVRAARIADATISPVS